MAAASTAVRTRRRRGPRRRSPVPRSLLRRSPCRRSGPPKSPELFHCEAMRFPAPHLCNERTGGDSARRLLYSSAEGNEMGILGWIVFGLVVGAIAKLLMPGRDPGGIIITMVLGIV